MQEARLRLFLLLVAALLTLLVLGPVLSGSIFADDFQFVLEDPHRHVLGSFGELHPYRLYRPIQLSIVALSQALFGPTTLPVHMAAMVVHLALVALLLRASGRIGLPPAAVVTASLWMATSQLLPAAIGGNDTISLVLGTFFGSLAAWWLWPVRARGENHRRIPHAFLAYMLALLSKESSLGYLPVLLAFLTVPPGESTRRGLLTALALTGVSAGYLLLRQSLGADGPRFGPEGDWALDRNIVVNVIQMTLASLLSISTVDVYSAIVRRELGVVLLAGASVLAFVLVVGLGLGLRRLPAVTLGVLLSLCIVAPVLPQRHVSELYAYALLPSTSLLIGVGVGSAWQRPGRGRRAGLVVLLALLFLGQVHAALRKSRDMARNGEVAGPLMGRLIELARHCPAGGTLILVEPEHARPQYSVFHMDGFRLTPPEEVLRLSGREDLRVLHLPSGSSVPVRPALSDTLYVTLVAGQPVPLVPAERLPLFSRPGSSRGAPATTR